MPAFEEVGENRRCDPTYLLGRWWLYSVSHRTFEFVVGDPSGSDNVVISVAACSHIAGPVGWPNQRLRIIWHNDRESGRAWVSVLEDEAVGFKAVGATLIWKRGWDLRKNGSLSSGRW